MTTTEINAKLNAGAEVRFCPWNDAFSNQCLVTLKSVAGNRTATYTWESGDGEPIEKTAQISYSAWNSIVASLRG